MPVAGSTCESHEAQTLTPHETHLKSSLLPKLLYNKEVVFVCYFSFCYILHNGKMED